jgi:uncharacterized protein
VSDFLEIPADQLNEDTLLALIEDFITREGTDYGDQEYTLAQKVAQVRRQLVSGRAVIAYDTSTESCTLILKE